LNAVAYAASLLAEVLTIKGLTRTSPRSEESQRLDKAEASRLTQIPQDQLLRYLAEREPGPTALKKIADGLELDGNFLLGIGHRFEGMSTRQAVAHMALDRYIDTHKIVEDDIDLFRYLADKHPDPPTWSREWEQISDSFRLARRRGQQAVGAQTAQSTRPYKRRVGRSQPKM
jgi:hypothetical protein